MPIDSSIALGIQVPQAKSPMVSLQEMMSLRDEQRRRQITDIQLQDAKAKAEENKITLESLRRKQADADKEDGILRKRINPQSGVIDYEGAMKDMLAAGLLEGAGKVQTQWNTSRAAAAKQIKDQIDSSYDMLKKAMPIVRSITDQATLDRARPALGAMLDKSWMQYIPETYDKAAFDQIGQWGLSAQETLELQRFAADQGTKALEAKGKEQDQNDKWKSSWAGWVASTHNDQELQDGMNTYRELGAPVDILTMFGTKWTPEIKSRARELAIGPKGLADLEIDRSRVGATGAEATTRARLAARQDAEQWKVKAIADLDKAFAQSVDTAVPMSQEQYDKRVSDIDSAYQRMMKDAGSTTQTPAPAVTPKSLPVKPMTSRDKGGDPAKRQDVRDRARRILMDNNLPTDDAAIDKWLSKKTNIDGVLRLLGGSQ